MNTITSLVSTTTCLELRDVLMNYASLHYSENNNNEERKEVVSILLRILFGRISSNHTTKRRKIQESPGRVRHAILSFLSKHSSSKDLDLWIYYMKEDFLLYDIQEQLQNVVGSKDVINVKNVPIPRIKGFLILLGDVMSNFGCHLTQCHVECFFKILLILLGSTSVKVMDDIDQKTIGDNDAGIKEEEDDDNDKIKQEENKINDDESLTTPSSPVSSIRSLICNRLLDLFLQHSTNSNTQEESFVSIFLTHKSYFWKITQSALQQLPTTVINCDATTKPTMLLSLIRAISSEETLLPFLSTDVIQVMLLFLGVKCVSPSIVNSCLDFTSNLMFLDDADDEKETSRRQDNNIGMKLLAPHMPLLLSQFTKRFEQFSNASTSATKTWRENSNTKHEQKRQLHTLCFTSEYFLQNDSRNNNEDDECLATLDSLCKLLLPFLKFSVVRKSASRTNSNYKDSFFLPIFKNISTFIA